jgi:HSP20 family protein
MLTVYEPWKMLNQFHKELEQFLGNYSNQTQGDSTIATSTWMPAVDIKEEEQRFIIYVDVPGTDPKEVEVFMENGVLTIKGERKAESQQDSHNYKRVERVYGSFYRRFSLPDTADADGISATGKNGVLEITIPKKATVQPRRIEIKVTE